MRIKDIKLLDDGIQQSVAIEFGTGEVRTLSAQQLYDTTRSAGQGATGAKTAAQRRAEELLAMRRNR
ncbi:MAG: hypothetical protein ACI8V2_003247 [Candidatus Latescibacterota bacterium]|jgi:hypothetical protein